MKTTAVRLYGVGDMRMETFDLPEITDEEILVKVITDSVCMSTYKAQSLGANHKRVPDDIATNPVIMGHEFAGVIEKVGSRWADKFKAGDKFAIQPNIGDPRGYSPGYSFPYFGGDATYTILPKEVMERGCLLTYTGDAFYNASLGEPMSCIIGAYHATYHTKPGVYVHDMGIVEGGSLALLACAGPMGLGAIDYAIHGPRRPKLLVVADMDEKRLARAELLFTKEDAKAHGVELHFVNNSKVDDPTQHILGLNGGNGYNDVAVYAPVPAVIELGDSLLGQDGCLNFFAGPVDKTLSAKFNFYNVHYGATHVVGTSGGNTDDLIESLDLTSENKINPAVMITHVGGLDSAAETTLNLPNIPGGKKLIYTGARMPLTALDEFEEKGKTDPFFAKLHELCEKHHGLWNVEAEQYMLKEKCTHY